jgi:hypothetical protein
VVAERVYHAFFLHFRLEEILELLDDSGYCIIFRLDYITIVPHSASTCHYLIMPSPKSQLIVMVNKLEYRVKLISER